MEPHFIVNDNTRTGITALKDHVHVLHIRTLFPNTIPGMVLGSSVGSIWTLTGPTQAPSEIQQIASNRDHKALNGGTLGGVGMQNYS